MNCIVIDDEPLARMGMEDLIATCPQLRLLKSFKNTVGVANYLKENAVHLIFLDIEMPGVNGLDFAKTIPENTLIIFTTAYSQYALDSYEVEAVDYLVKPIHLERFKKAVTKAETYFNLLKNAKASLENTTTDYISIRADRQNYRVYHRDILYIEALKDYVIIHTPNEKHITWINLKNIHLQLPKEQFLRVNKSYVVNIAYITSYSNHTIFVGTTEINIGKVYKEDFFSRLQ